MKRTEFSDRRVQTVLAGREVRDVGLHCQRPARPGDLLDFGRNSLEAIDRW